MQFIAVDPLPQGRKWIAHFAPSLVLSRLAPKTPLSLLAFAGAIPDFLFFVFTIIGQPLRLFIRDSLTCAKGLESAKFSDKFDDPSYKSPTGGPGSHCFPYDCDNPYTHSFTGEVTIGILFAAAATVFYRLPIISFVTLFLATLTHYPLDLMVHRHDVALTTSEPVHQRHGFPLFDYPIILFLVDLALFIGPLWFHLRTANPGTDQAQRKTAVKAYAVAALAAILVEANFAFMGAPTQQVRLVHAPIFSAEILGISWAMGKMEEHTDAAGKKQLTPKEAKEAMKKVS